MTFYATWILVIVFCLHAVICITIPQMDATPYPFIFTNTGVLVYKEVSKVTVTCSLAKIYEDIELQLIPFEVILNPVFHGGKLPKYSHRKNVLDIEYPPEVFLALINVTCNARNRTSREIMSTSTIQIEQLYETMYSGIQGYITHKDVQGGANVSLHCVADGNPLPDQYQWYNQTAAGDQQLGNQTKSSITFTAAEKYSSRSVLVCGSKNELRTDFLKTIPVTVNSIYIPKPEFLASPLPIFESSVNKSVFMEVAKIDITCSIPLMLVPEDVEVRMKYKQVECNPVYCDEEVTVSQNNSQLHIQYNPKKYVTQIEVTCSAMKRATGMTFSSNQILIEQQYKTKNVVLDELVAAGRKLTLRCLADGNPSPQYQWFLETREGFVATNNVNASFLEITPNERGVYMCGARNKHNNEFVTSNSMKITS